MDQTLRLWAGRGPRGEVVSGGDRWRGVGDWRTHPRWSGRRWCCPRWRRRRLRLGCVGTVLVSVVAAHAVDHGFGTALMARGVRGGDCGDALKSEIDRGFEGASRALR